MSPDAVLPTRRIERGSSLAQTEPWGTAPVTLASPALAVMTDLTKVKAATTPPGTRLPQAEQLMIYQGVRMLFVVGSMPAIEGLVTHTDLDGERAMRIVQQRGVRHDEITVGDVMTELAALEAVALSALRTAQVSNVVATLKAHGRDHLLVVDGATPPRVVGIVSRSQVARQLGMPIEVVEVAGSFAELKQLLT
jgi:CBS-domain-containing membrane protein